MVEDVAVPRHPVGHHHEGRAVLDQVAAPAARAVPNVPGPYFRGRLRRQLAPGRTAARSSSGPSRARTRRSAKPAAALLRSFSYFLPRNLAALRAPRGRLGQSFGGRSMSGMPYSPPKRTGPYSRPEPAGPVAGFELLELVSLRARVEQHEIGDRAVEVAELLRQHRAERRPDERRPWSCCRG